MYTHTLLRVHARVIDERGMEDGLQLQSLMARGTKAPAFAKLPELVANCCKQLINYARTGQHARQRERQGLGQD